MTLKGSQILLVDDHVDLAESLSEILTEEGAQVRHATTASQISALARQPFDVALVDIGLPDATGLSLLPSLKAAGDGQSEVLVLTGSAALDDAIGAVRAGAYDYVLKPFDPEALLTSVARALAKVRLSRQASGLSAALRESEANLRTLVDTVQALLVVLDADGLVVRANQAVARLTGRSVADLAGTSWVESFVSAPDRAGFSEAFRRLVGGEPAAGSQEYRVRLERETGALEVRWISWASSVLRLEDGTTRVYASGIDVTDTRALERRTRLNEKLAAVGTLAAGLAHEIRNPLNGAHLQLRLLERRLTKAGGADQLFEPIHVVHGEISRLSHLVDDFLRFARPTEINVTDVDLSAIVRRVVALEAPRAERAGAGLAMELRGGSVHIQGDEEKLQQVLLNLVRNAIEAVSGEGQISVSVHGEGESVHVTVRDNGVGIATENISRIFEPFFSTKPNGTGLGMAICHSLISVHGGEIQVRCDAGTVVEIVLPTVPPASVGLGRGVLTGGGSR
ncbi:MAG: ATP-binding protein [Nannocystaceae bacterium]